MYKFSKKLNNKKNKVVIKRGFTLVEVIVSLGIFVIIIGGSSGAFIGAFKSYKGAKNTNESLKDSQYAMNLMSKTFRTSSVKYSSSSTVIVYDHSQLLCIRYRFYGGALMKTGLAAGSPESNCSNGASFPAEVPMTIGTVSDGVFNVVASSGNDISGASTEVGKITVSMKVTNSLGSSPSSSRIQSTSSLRDYSLSNVGIDFINAP